MNTSVPDLRIRDLRPDDEPAVRSFECVAKPLRPWERHIDELITDHLAFEVAKGTANAIGLWIGTDPTLTGVAFWQIAADGHSWQISIVATRLGVRRRGYGTVLKQTVIDRARVVGATSIRSLVHRDNKAMIEMNERLGAIVAPATDDPRRDYFLCMIAL